MVLLFHSARDEAKGWLHCKEKKKSTPPLQERLCDLSVYMSQLVTRVFELGRDDQGSKRKALLS